MKLLLFFLLYAQSCHAGIFDWFSFLSNQQYAAVQAYQHQDYEQSLTTLSSIIDTDPYNAQANYNVGNIFYKKKKYQDAKSAFLRAAEQKKASLLLQEQAYFNAGNSAYQLEQWQDAVQFYRKVLELNADNQSAQHNLQLALYKLKEQEMKDQAQQEQQKEQQKYNQQAKTDQNNNQCMNNKNQSQDDSAQGQSQDNDGGQNGSSGTEQNQKNEQGKEQKKGSSNYQDSSHKKQEDGENFDEQHDQSDGSFEQSQIGNSKDKSSEKNGHDKQLKDYEQQMREMEQDVKEKLSSNNAEQEENDDKSELNGHDISAVLDGQHEENSQLEQGAGEQQDGVQNQEQKKFGGMYKKPELHNHLQQEYESKASDDERLTEYHALVMKTLEDLEEKIQKHVIKNKVAMQGAGQHGKKGW